MYPVTILEYISIYHRKGRVSPKSDKSGMLVIINMKESAYFRKDQATGKPTVKENPESVLLPKTLFCW